MVKVPNVWALLRRLRPELKARASAAGVPRPCELGMQTDGAKILLSFTRRGVKLVPGRLGRSYLRLAKPDFARLLLGGLNLPEAVESGRVQTSTLVARQLADTLFPRLPWWRPPLDDLIE